MTEIFYTPKTKVQCSGKDFPEDHPLVYLEIDPEKEEVMCPYCDKKFCLTR